MNRIDAGTVFASTLIPIKVDRGIIKQTHSNSGIQVFRGHNSYTKDNIYIFSFFSSMKCYSVRRVTLPHYNNTFIFLFINVIILLFIDIIGEKI